MNLPFELEDKYVKKVIYNRSLKNLPQEEWKSIEGFEDYMVSNYGRVKSLERKRYTVSGKEYILPERVLTLIAIKHFNSYLQDNVYNIQCRLSVEGKAYNKSVARLVYYHFIEKINWEDRTVVMGFKDNNRFHLHISNLEKISAHEKNLRVYRFDRSKNLHIEYLKPISQYTAEGDFVADFENFYAADKALGVGLENILKVINKENLTAGSFRWFLQSNLPEEKDFLIHEKYNTSGRLLNDILWKRLGKPAINQKKPPPVINLSIKSLFKERWKPIDIPELKSKFAISDRGRIKRLVGWNSDSRRRFLKEMIFPLSVEFNSHTNYFLCCELHDNEKKVSVSVFRLLYYYFVKEFDLNDKTLIVTNENEPKWNIDLSKLSLQRTNSESLKETNDRNLLVLNKMLVLLNSGEKFNEALWKRLGSPRLNKRNPPAVMNLSMKDLPNEIWVPIPDFEDKYAISNAGRVKRLSGWSFGAQLFGEEQIMPLCVNKENEAHHLYFRLHRKVCTNQMILIRFLYYCFVENFDLKDRSLQVVNQNESLWDINLSKLSLSSIKEIRSKKAGKK
nr:NUMOD4 domain-containing protein [uncultured Chryseobacterium sp.]